MLIRLISFQPGHTQTKPVCLLKPSCDVVMDSPALQYKCIMNAFMEAYFRAGRGAHPQNARRLAPTSSVFAMLFIFDLFQLSVHQGFSHLGHGAPVCTAAAVPLRPPRTGSMLTCIGDVLMVKAIQWQPSRRRISCERTVLGEPTHFFLLW